MAKDVLYRRSINAGSNSRSSNNSGSRNSGSASRNASEPKGRPPAVSFAVRVGGPVPDLPSASAHSDAALLHSRLAAAHSQKASQMSRDAQRERPRKR